jgi:ABC-type antimicrobial peptide transport system, permease component
MQLKQLIKIAIRSLNVNKSRSFLTALGVIIGVASVILLVSVGSGLKDFITGQMQDMGSNLIMIVPGDIDIEAGAEGGAAGGAFSSITASKLELSDVEEIERNLSQIEDAAAVVMAPGLASYKSEAFNGQIIGTTQNYVNIRSSEFETGGFFTESEVNSGRKVAVLGHTIAHELFGDQNPLGEKLKLGLSLFGYGSDGGTRRSGQFNF